MVSTRSATKAELAAEVWSQIFDFLVATHEQRDRILQRFGLTPGDSKALMHLDSEMAQSMGSLAAAWSCDASNATWMVDRLEQRGLVERRAVAGERRVKAVVLTSEGIAMKAALNEARHEPPPEVLELPRPELEAMAYALAKLTEL